MSTVTDASTAIGACPLCGAQAAPQHVLGAVGNTHPGPFTVDAYDLVECTACDTVRLDPIPGAEDLRTLYERSVQFADAHYTDEAQVARMLDYYGTCLDQLGLMPADGERMLEVGAGFAWVSRACRARSTGVETWAQDVTDECAARCPWVDHYVVGMLDAIPGDLRFRLVSLTHVIEHLADPAAILRDLAGRLAPGGRIFVTAPFRPVGWQTGGGIDAWRSYAYLHVPAHIGYLSRRWFEQVAASCGLQLQRWDPSHEDGQAFEAVLVQPPAAPVEAPPQRPAATQATAPVGLSRVFAAVRRRWWPRQITEPAATIVSAADRTPDDAIDPDYARRAQQEVERFATDVDVHALPEIFHYWSNRYLRPILESFGFSHPDDFFARQIAAVQARTGRPVRVISIGAGNCDTEVRVAAMLRDRGVDGFRIECLDLNPAMLERGAALAAAEGLADRLGFVRGDFNRWRPDGRYDVVMANQSLHHVLELEVLFDAIHGALAEDGAFITSDEIGRNGHQRWPEALAIVQEFWRELPKARRWNVQLRRHEARYLDWNCAVEGFEGIRAQDILPLLIERFGFETFAAWGNVVDAFVGRSFGHHFDAGSEADRAFIDRVHARDEAEILAGRIKPTHMMAVMRRDRSIAPRVWRHLTPAFCVRDPKLP